MASTDQRKPVIGGNWKMNTDLASARSLAGEIVVGVSSEKLDKHCEIVVCPPFPYLTSVGDVIRGSGVALAAQDVYHEPKGAYTGEVGTAMLEDIGVTHVIVGHSERRHVIEPVETDAVINRKLRAVLHANLTAIFCIGETLEQREAGKTEEITLRQLEAGLDGVSEEHMAHLIIAYEPVWAIGTGHTATPEDAQKVHHRLRQMLASRYNDRLASSVRLQYGGSVKADNAASLFAQPDIDGFLVGGASLQGTEFLNIVRAVL